MTKPQIPFALAQVRVSSSPSFPAIILDDAAVVPIDAILPLAARLGFALGRANSLDDILRNWDQNFAALCAVVMALDDPTEGKYFRSAVSALEFFTTDTPLTSPRQILSHNSFGDGTLMPRLASSLVGPTAKILIPDQSSGLWGEVKLGVAIARPIHRASVTDAAAAIAGFVTVSDYTIASEWDAGRTLAAKHGPTLLAAGPYLVPAAFADAQRDLKCMISFNGENANQFGGADISNVAETVSNLSHDIQLFPGDLLCLGPKSAVAGQQCLGDGDIIEAAISGLGRQTTNTIRES